ncbi:MAG: helix-turn-helix domain-containing protein, partial [Methanosarcinales archaeon]
DEFERKMIINHLISNNWSVAKAARSLNVERTNLYKKIKKLDIKLK